MLQLLRIELHKQVVHSTKITKLILALFESSLHLTIQTSHGRNKPYSFPPQSSQAWNFKPKPSPMMNPSEAAPFSWPKNHRSFLALFIIKVNFRFEPLVWRTAKRSHFNGRHGVVFWEWKEWRLILKIIGFETLDSLREFGFCSEILYERMENRGRLLGREGKMWLVCKSCWVHSMKEMKVALSVVVASHLVEWRVVIGNSLWIVGHRKIEHLSDSIIIEGWR